MRNLFTIIALLQISHFVQAQSTQKDSLAPQQIQPVTINADRVTSLLLQPPVCGIFITSGKKSEVISVVNLDANLAERTARQIFAKIPGVFVYDMDGSGNQLSISTRGLDPHRGWEFNIRSNGVITNSDMYGYPASHYNAPMEAIERVGVVRGSGSLQYGAQFGGMLNYITKHGDTTRRIGLESINSIGSYGLLSTYNAIGGKVGRLQYYTYYSKRESDGYRDNAASKYDAQGLLLRYWAGRRLTLSAELVRSKYLFRLPGPLTDSMFHENPRQATRARSYYSPEIYVPSLSAEWRLRPRTRLQWTVSAVLGSRNSVMFDKPATTVDKIDPTTLTYANRQVDMDRFNSYTSELRFLQFYEVAGRPAALTAGVQYMNNDLHRRQQGKGTTGSAYDLSITGDWGRDLHFKTQNIAFFAENRFNLTTKWTVSPGIRVESGQSDMTGRISYLEAQEVPNSIKHKFPLLGLNTEYQFNGELSVLYAGFSQAYRPVIFKDIIPASLFERSDKNLKDAYGYNLEAGFRGRAGVLRWDVGVFRLQYNNRLGNLSYENNGTFYILKTNIGDSYTQGVEAFVEYNFETGGRLRGSVFSSTSYFDSHYQNAEVRVGNTNQSVSGNQVESVPNWISRNGLNLRYRGLSVSFLYSYTGKSYADALNTETPSATGAVGLVPAYALLDINSSLRINQSVVLRLNVNNVADKQYFTKRPTFYPGPGIWPSDGRSVSVSLGVRL